ncbi:jg23019 [Pararge aegeria aegeria]|uniref:Jg23019 protein n=1 Tax=Pararge aegeria aegeria TaxID=348720 RepID=A0A8S4SHX4_9NEOP|nr:jg23019 [Pararge aegeria aegeria]
MEGVANREICTSVPVLPPGQPLCNCGDNDPEPVNWSAVCGTFCSSDNYVLRGCPTCEESATPAITAALSTSRSLNTEEGWRSWCNVQCRQGQGGAACNCDRAPFQ